MSNSKKTNKEVELIATAPKKYNIMILFNPILNDQVDDTIAKNKLKCDRRITGYARFDAVSEEEYTKIKELFKDCKVENIKKVEVYDRETRKFVTKTVKRTITPQIVAHRAKITVWVEKKKTNNTKEVRQAARAARKARNIANHPKFVKRADKTKKTPTAENINIEGKGALKGKNAKTIKFRHARHKFKSVAKVTPGKVETLRDKKLRERALKAGRYLIKKEVHKDPVSKKAKTPKSKKPVQQTLKLAA